MHRWESVAGTFAIGDRIVIVQYNGTTALPKTTLTRALHLDTNRGSLSIATRGSTFGHNAAASVQTMAATFWNSGKLGTGPVHRFDQPRRVVQFPTGPRAIFYTAPTATNPTGTQIGTRHPDLLQPGRRRARRHGRVSPWPSRTLPLRTA